MRIRAIRVVSMITHNDKTWKWLNPLPSHPSIDAFSALIRHRAPWIIATLLSIIWGAAIVSDGRPAFQASNTTMTDSPTPTIVLTQPSPIFNITNATSLNLFGKVEIAHSEIDPATLPNATSNLKLVGLLTNSRPGASRSLIAESDRPAKYYAEGDLLPGSVKVFRIESKCVIVQRGDQLEKLNLPGSSIGTVATLPRNVTEIIQLRIKAAASDVPPTISKNESDKSAGPQAIYQALNASLTALQKKKKSH